MDIVAGNVDMRHEAHFPGVIRQPTHALLAQVARELHRGNLQRGNIQGHHIGTLIASGRLVDVVEQLMQQRRVLMVFSQALDMIVHRIKPGSRHHAGLMQVATEPFTVFPGSLYQVLGTHHDRTDRRAQALGQAHGQEIGIVGIRRYINAGCDGRMEDARAIQVTIGADILGIGEDIVHLLQRKDGAAFAPQRVFDHHHPWQGVVLAPTAFGSVEFFQVTDREQPAVVG